MILIVTLAIAYCHFSHDYGNSYYNHFDNGGDGKFWLLLRLGQWLHILRMGDRFKPWRLLISVIWQQRYQFMITFYMCLVWLIFVTFIMFLVEQSHQNHQSEFTSLPKTFWWSIVSLFTIGYGDMTPATNIGKVVASIFFFLFIFKFALPAGVLSTGLALKIQDQQR
ncbi:hypothetical protein BLA29_011702, partial [Euroglyphus maynei]